MRILTALAAIFLILTPIAGRAETAVRQIVVSGEGRVSAVPDMAVIDFGVSREAREAAAAMQAATEAMTSVLAQIAAAGIPERDVQTTRVGLDPRWQHSENAPPRIAGYVATNDLRVVVRDLDMLGGLLDAVVAEGANTMNGLSFDLTESDALADEARAAAVADAARKAETLARAAGVTLGEVQSLSEFSGGARPVPMMEAAMMERAAVPVQAGQVEIVVTIQAVFAIAGE